MTTVFDSRTVSSIFKLLARREEPVSVNSTIASASRGGFASVAPHEYSMFAFTLFCLQYFFTKFTSSVAIVFP